jgi:hypothetical protein
MVLDCEQLKVGFMLLGCRGKICGGARPHRHNQEMWLKRAPQLSMIALLAASSLGLVHHPSIVQPLLVFDTFPFPAYTFPSSYARFYMSPQS